MFLQNVPSPLAETLRCQSLTTFILTKAPKLVQATHPQSHERTVLFEEATTMCAPHKAQRNCELAFVWLEKAPQREWTSGSAERQRVTSVVQLYTEMQHRPLEVKFNVSDVKSRM